MARLFVIVRGHFSHKLAVFCSTFSKHVCMWLSSWVWCHVRLHVFCSQNFFLHIFRELSFPQHKLKQNGEENKMNHLLRVAFARALPVSRDWKEREPNSCSLVSGTFLNRLYATTMKTGKVACSGCFYFQRIKTEQSLSLKCSVDKNDGRTARACLEFWLKKMSVKKSLFEVEWFW